jgi:hypothetical protein
VVVFAGQSRYQQLGRRAFSSPAESGFTTTTTTTTTLEMPVGDGMRAIIGRDERPP